VVEGIRDLFLETKAQQMIVYAWSEISQLFVSLPGEWKTMCSGGGQPFPAASNPNYDVTCT
jgi:hypothetical protein